jgi:hypothetical protein
VKLRPASTRAIWFVCCVLCPAAVAQQACAESPGVLTIGGSYSWSGGTHYLWKIADATGSVGIGWSLLDVKGTLTIAGTPSNPCIIDIKSLTVPDPGPALNFDNHHAYHWLVASGGAGVAGYDPANFSLVTTLFTNPMGIGRFATSQSGTGLYVDFVPSMAGDANCDGTVDIADLSILLTNFDKSGMAWSDGDFDGSGTVAIDDLSKTLTNFDKTVVGAGPSRYAVPEPASIAILLAVAAGVFAYRRRLAV